jgi:hypothetical protein
MNYTRPSASELRTRYESSRLVDSNVAAGGEPQKPSGSDLLPEFYSTPH